jgi:hypothetical protein
MLHALARGLAVLREAGFGGDGSARTLKTVVGYPSGGGDGGHAARDRRHRPARQDQFDSLVQLARTLPPDTAPELVRIARLPPMRHGHGSRA